MEKHQDKLRLATIVLLSSLIIGFGAYAAQTPMLLGGAAGLVYALGATGMLCRRQRQAPAAATPG